MLIMQFDEKLRRWNCIGVGRVLAPEGQNPIRKICANAVSKLSFSVNVGTTLNAQKQHVYRTVNCGIFENSWLKTVYEIALTLQRNDTVLFAGWVKESPAVNQATGQQIIFKECRVEWICRLKDIPKAVPADIKPSQIFVRNDDDVLF